MIVVENGTQVGRVNFDPYEYTYDGDTDLVEFILSSGEDLRAIEGGPIDPDTEAVSEAHVEIPRGEKVEVMNNDLQRLNVELVPDDTVRFVNDDETPVYVLNAYQAGDRVKTPDGLGVVDDRITSGEVDGLEASDDSPVYAVATVESGVEFYKGSDLESATEADFGVAEERDEGVSELRGNSEISANDWTMPASWRKSEKPSRLILLDAWASMGGQFDCGGGCCMGELHSERLCAAMKDEVLGTERWRGGWV